MKVSALRGSRVGCFTLTVLWGALLPAPPILALPEPSPVPGGIALVPVAPLAVTAPPVFYRGGRVLVVQDAEHWVAVIGIALATPSGQQTLTILHANGTAQTRHFMVRDKAYEAQHLSFKNHRMVNPKPQDLKRIGRDERRIRSALAKWSDTAPPELVLQKPVEGPFSSPFGLRRFFNAQPRKPHRGLDIAAPKGTPIKAPLGGRVIESGNFFFNGNTVFLDHGQGLVTLYCHMDRIDVRAGQRLERGEQIGTVGATGRVTGPHLHWGVSLNQTLIDPLLFLPTRSATAWSAPRRGSAPASAR